MCRTEDLSNSSAIIIISEQDEAVEATPLIEAQEDIPEDYFVCFKEEETQNGRALPIEMDGSIE